ncbi:Rpn family recombination-promoting nuclease/putative transposase [bacterium]|nr:Rpn family recombination-promoting nuclease/putative transposase [bacterium]
MKQSPHEGLFKSLMTRKENGQTFLSAVLPEGVLTHLYLESLTVENISYVDDHLMAS